MHLAVAHDEARLGHKLLQLRSELLDGLHAVMHEEDLPAALQLAQDDLPHQLRRGRRSRKS